MRLVRVVGALLLGLLVLALVGAAAVWFVVFAPVSTVDEVDFDTPLAVPPEATSRVEPDGTRVFELTAQQGIAKPAAGVSARSWGFNGAHLGPTLRAARGEHVRVEVTNALDEATNVHWHGMHLPAAADGGPHQPVAPGATWTPAWTVDQPAATLWYHPHPHGATEDHVAGAWPGMFIVDDPEARSPTHCPTTTASTTCRSSCRTAHSSTDGESPRAPIGCSATTCWSTARSAPTSTSHRAGAAAAAQRLHRPRVRLRAVRRPPVRADRHRRRAAGPAARRPGCRCRPASGRRSWCRSGPARTWCCAATQPDLGAKAFADRFDGGHDEFDVLQLRAADTLAPGPPTCPARLAPATASMSAAATRRGRSCCRAAASTAARWTCPASTPSSSSGRHRGVGGRQHRRRLPQLPRPRRPVPGALGGRRPPPRELAGWKDTVYLRPGGTGAASDCGSPTTPTRTRRTCSTATCCSTRTTG